MSEKRKMTRRDAVKAMAAGLAIPAVADGQEKLAESAIPIEDIAAADRIASSRPGFIVSFPFAGHQD